MQMTPTFINNQFCLTENKHFYLIHVDQYLIGITRYEININNNIK